MPTPVSAARQCLAQDAAVALDDAVSNAARRGHAQTTSLHVFSALLSLPSSSPSPLRDALSRSRSSSYSPRVQLRALDLCFSSALDRLPSPSNPNPEEPPVSNSLMAAIKRSQANQRRNPETFHLYQQQQQQTPSSPTTTTTTTIFAGVKVELQQLILAMLDDPVISRVFADAGFRSNDVKLALLRPPPSSVLRLPRATRLPPLFLCNFSTAHDDLEPVPRIGSGFPFATELLFPDGSEENCRRIGEMMVKGTGKGRNPLLVGAGAAAALRDFERVLGSGKGGELPKEIAGLRFFSVEEGVRGRGRESVLGTAAMVTNTAAGHIPCGTRWCSSWGLNVQVRPRNLLPFGSQLITGTATTTASRLFSNGGLTTISKSKLRRSRSRKKPLRPSFSPVMEWQDCSAEMEIDVPCSIAYDCYSDRESIPLWMPFISSVKVLKDKPDLSRWLLKYEVFGQDVEFSWLARNLQPICNQKIHWRSLEGLPNRGAVRFYPKGPSACRVELTVSYEVPRILTPVASAIRPFLQSLLLRGLEQFATVAKGYQNQSSA